MSHPSYNSSSYKALPIELLKREDFIKYLILQEATSKSIIDDLTGDDWQEMNAAHSNQPLVGLLDGLKPGDSQTRPSTDSLLADIHDSILCHEEEIWYPSEDQRLGHVQQGGSPSPFDRNLGTKLAARALEYLITQAKEALQPDGSVNATRSDTMTLLGLTGRRLVFTPIKELEEETDFSVRLPKTQRWLKLRPLLRILAKHSSIYHTEAEFEEPILE